MSALIIAIDGPSGSGKSTISKILSERMGITYIDTGAMYRAVALKSRETDVMPNDFAGLGEIARSSKITFNRIGSENHTILDGKDVSDLIRLPEITMLTSEVSKVPEVRDALVALH